MSPTRFDRFCLDPQDRRLTRDGETVEISGRYLDALALLVAERGRLVTKDRFMDEVWKGVPVTDEALTQCVRSLRRVLGDDAARPRFIETVPKHGYRFIAEVRQGPAAPAQATPIAPAGVGAPPPIPLWRRVLPDAAGATTGGGAAGAVGGLIYGLAVSPSSLGAASTLLVLTCGATLLAMTAGAAVGLGVGLGRETIGRGGAGALTGALAGGGIGGMLIGGVVNLLGLDALSLLTGRAPSAMTGAGEGLALGAAVGLGAWLARRDGTSGRRGAAQAGAVGAAAGVGIALAGGRLLGGSLEALVKGFPDAPLSLAPLGRLTGEAGFGPATQMVTAGLEGALFAACVVAAMTLIRRDGEAGSGSA